MQLLVEGIPVQDSSEGSQDCVLPDRLTVDRAGGAGGFHAKPYNAFGLLLPGVPRLSVVPPELSASPDLPSGEALAIPLLRGALARGGQLLTVIWSVLLNLSSRVGFVAPACMYAVSPMAAGIRIGIGINVDPWSVGNPINAGLVR